MGSLSHKLPLINFNDENLRPGTNERILKGKEVLNALEEYGCFVAMYDKVPRELQSDVFGKIRVLFDLPIETKRKNVSKIPYYGYIENQPIIQSCQEALVIHDVETLGGTKDFTNTMWPSGNDEFCKVTQSYSKGVSELEQMVMRMVFESYGLESYESHRESTTYMLRMIKYGEPNEGDNLGLAAHTDKGFLTLLQQNEVSGLEVQTRDGHWIRFDQPASPSFIVIAGDALLAWSNERIRAAPHRVMIKKESNARYSVGLFSYRRGITEVPAKLIDDEHPLKFKAFDNFGLLHFYVTQEARAVESVIKAYCGV